MKKMILTWIPVTAVFLLFTLAGSGFAATTPSPTPTPTPGDPPEERSYCFYQDSQGKTICLAPQSENVNPSDCPSFPPCGTTGITCPATKKLPNECPNTPPPFASPSGPPTVQPRDLGELIEGIFKWSLWIVGLAVFVMFIYAGFLRLIAAGDPGKISQSKSIMTDAALGGLLLLSAYLILNTINPDFVKQSFTLPPLP